MQRFFLVLLALAGLQAGSLHAQRISDSAFPSIEPAPPPAIPPINAFQRHEVSPALLAAGGILGGAAGVFGGALAGAHLTGNSCEDCALVGAAYGAVAGGSALLPLGVHLANGRRGSYGSSLLASLAVGVVGLGVADAANSVEVMMAVPVLQIVSAVLIERATGRRRWRKTSRRGIRRAPSRLAFGFASCMAEYAEPRHQCAVMEHRSTSGG